MNGERDGKKVYGELDIEEDQIASDPPQYHAIKDGKAVEDDDKDE